MTSKNITRIYSDFDGTITKEDTVNRFFELYADEKWTYYEDLWTSGKISSRENAINQVNLIKPISEKELADYINSIELDEYFTEFIKYLKQNEIELIILSDGFDLFIKKILERNGIHDIKFYANHLIYHDKKFSIEFPYFNSNCPKSAGMCKCNKITEANFCYIGDGTSDLCVAEKAKYLFATKNLHEFCNKNSIKHYYFNSFYNIINTLEQIKG